jgi:hypothetical protein
LNQVRLFCNRMNVEPELNGLSRFDFERDRSSTFDERCRACTRRGQILHDGRTRHWVDQAEARAHQFRFRVNRVSEISRGGFHYQRPCCVRPSCDPHTSRSAKQNEGRNGAEYGNTRAKCSRRLLQCLAHFACPQERATMGYPISIYAWQSLTPRPALYSPSVYGTPGVPLVAQSPRL